jgi:hypothetical protein
MVASLGVVAFRLYSRTIEWDTTGAISGFYDIGHGQRAGADERAAQVIGSHLVWAARFKSAPDA